MPRYSNSACGNYRQSKEQYKQRRSYSVLCADNGVTEEGTASAPQSVTYSQTINISRHLTGVGALADCFGTDILVTDVGVNADFPEEMLTLDPVVHNCSTGVCRQTLAEGIVNRKSHTVPITLPKSLQ